MIHEPDGSAFLQLAQSIGVMKPATVKKEDEKGQKRLQQILNSNEYVLEHKEDGCHYKMLGYRFFSTDNVEKTNNFPHLRDFFKKLKMYNLILDGEIHYPGRTSQYATHVTGPLPENAVRFQENAGYIHYTIFDMLRTPKANWLIKNTYKERRRVLKYFYDTFIRGTEMEQYIHLVPAVMDNKEQYLENLLATGAEGGVLKRLDSIYVMGKKPMWQWMKVKQSDAADLIIIGFEPPTKEYKGKNIESWQYWIEENGVSIPVTKDYYHGWVGSVVFGAYVDGKLMKVCTASGMSDSVRQHMTENQELYLNKVARVEFMEKTDDGIPRHPSFKNLHETKLPEECTWVFERSL